MSLITIIWSMASAVCFTIAFQQFMIWLKKRDHYRYLFTFFAALGGATAAIFELLTLKSTTFTEMSFALIYLNVSVALIILGLTWLIYFYFKTANKWLAFSITALWVIVLFVNTLSEFSVVYTKLTNIHNSQLYNGESFSVPEGVVNNWKFLADLASLLFVVYVIMASIKLWKSGLKSRASIIGGAIFFFIVVAGIYTPLVDEGFIKAPSIISFTFLGIIVAISYEMSSEIIKSSELSKQIVHNEKRWRNLLENVHLLIVGLDKNGKVNFVNPYYLRLTGFDENEVLGEDWFLNFLPESEIQLVKEKFNNISSKSATKFQNRILLKNKNEKIIDWSNVELYDRVGEVISTLSIGVDVTSRYDAFEEIKELKERLEVENIHLRQELNFNASSKEIIGNSDVIKYALARVEQVSKTETTVLIEGETGVGKELFASAIHRSSSRSNIPLVTLNCAAMPLNLIESELFGHEKGAFTGADHQRKGRFEFADNGTIFLDEIGELSLELQSKLLRFLESGEFQRLGSNETIKVDVRIITATNRNLHELIKEKRFREDLYYRISTYPISIPPLRKRINDIPLLVDSFVETFSRQQGKNIDKISRSTLEMLKNYNWPGNVRELKNVIERAVINTNSNKLILRDNLKPNNGNSSNGNKYKSLEIIEREYIEEVLKNCNWKITGQDGAAEILDLHPNTLRSRMKKLGICK